MTKEEREKAIEVLTKRKRCKETKMGDYIFGTEKKCADTDCEECPLHYYLNNDLYEAEKTALEALKQEPCEDAISRQITSDYVQSHIQELNAGYGDLNAHTNRILRMIVEYIEKMPSVTPTQKMGKWIQTSNFWEDGPCGARYFPCQCSQCGYKTHTGNLSDFCPDCGAMMEDPE